MKKVIIINILLTLCATTTFARIDYKESTTVVSDINDNWVCIDYPSMAGSNSTTKGNVVVTVEKNVSVTADYLKVYGSNSSIVFLGNNQVNAGTIGIEYGADLTGSSMKCYNSTINADHIYLYATTYGAGSMGTSVEFYDNSIVNVDKISLRDIGTNLIVKNSQVTISGTLLVNTGSKVVVDGGTLTAAGFLQTGAPTRETVADIEVLNGGTLILDGKSNYHGHNIYVDSTSNFTNENNDSYYGTLTIESGANVSLAEKSEIAFENITLVLDDTIVSTGSELDLSGFNGVKIGEETIALAAISDKIVLQDNNGHQYKMSFDETSGSYNAGEYIGAVPEPSTYAIIFGALALGFVIYNRRK